MTEEPHRESSAAAAAEQVRAILEAAERETDAQLRRVRETSERLSTRTDEIDRELDRLTAGVREAIQALRDELGELRGGARTGVGPASEPVPAPAPGSEGGSPAPEPDLPATAPEPAADPPAEALAAPDSASAGAGAGSEGARVIALNMALSGAPREETAHYLAENFELDDPEALLDEVYARVTK